MSTLLLVPHQKLAEGLLLVGRDRGQVLLLHWGLVMLDWDLVLLGRDWRDWRFHLQLRGGKELGGRLDGRQDWHRSLLQWRLLRAACCAWGPPAAPAGLPAAPAGLPAAPAGGRPGAVRPGAAAGPTHTRKQAYNLEGQ